MSCHAPRRCAFEAGAKIWDLFSEWFQNELAFFQVADGRYLETETCKMYALTEAIFVPSCLKETGFYFAASAVRMF